METKATRASFKAGDAGSFTAVFATLGVPDREDDVTVPGAFEQGKAVKISAWNHDHSQLPVGAGIIYADNREAWVKGQFWTDTDAGRAHYETAKRLGPNQEWSYGFRILEAARGQHQGRSVRFLKKVDVFECSQVMVAAGTNTRTTEIKSLVAPAPTLIAGGVLTAEQEDYLAHEALERGVDQADHIALYGIKAGLVGSYWHRPANGQIRYVRARPRADSAAAVKAAWPYLCDDCRLFDRKPALDYFRRAMPYDTPERSPGSFVDGDIRGLWTGRRDTYGGGEVLLKRDLDPAAAVATAAHELAHARGAAEPEALAYGDVWHDRYLDGDCPWQR